MNVLTQRHRAQQLLLRKVTRQQVAKVWPALKYEALDDSYPRLAAAVAPIVKANRLTSSGLAVGYVREMRRQAKVLGTLTPNLAPSLVVDQLTASLHATSVAHIKAATGRGVAPDLAMSNGLSEAIGAMARLVLDAGRVTTLQTLASDSRAVGFERVLGGSGCQFCQMLAGRGGVYSADTADFEAHDHCGCTAEPVYRA